MRLFNRSYQCVEIGAVNCCRISFLVLYECSQCSLSLSSQSIFILSEKSWSGSSLLYRWQKSLGNYIAVAGWVKALWLSSAVEVVSEWDAMRHVTILMWTLFLSYCTDMTTQSKYLIDMDTSALSSVFRGEFKNTAIYSCWNGLKMIPFNFHWTSLPHHPPLLRSDAVWEWTGTKTGTSWQQSQLNPAPSISGMPALTKLPR